MKKVLNLFLLILPCLCFGQQSFPLTDTSAVVSDGLKAGYTINSEKEKEVGNKGNFSRYSVHFYVTNIGSQAKIILYKQGLNLLGSDVFHNLVQFRCLNATGARMTSKELNLEAKPCNVQAIVEEADASGKTVQNNRSARIGYWIKPGETVSSNTIFIVPLNEKPNIAVTFLPGVSIVGSTIATNSFAASTDFLTSTTTQTPLQGFMRIKNISDNSFLNNQPGYLACTGIDNSWASAQWEFLPVKGTSYFQIHNRWRNVFISAENGNLLSENGQSPRSMWSLQEYESNNAYIIRNAANNYILVLQNGILNLLPFYRIQPNAEWVVE